MTTSVSSPAVLDTTREKPIRARVPYHSRFVGCARIMELQEESVRLFQRRDLIDSDNIRCRWQNHVETGECLFDCFDPVIDLSPAFERLVYYVRIVGAVSQLYGEPACLFKDKLIFKAPGAMGYGLHQDYISWPSFPESFVTVIVAIDPASAGNGATEVFPGFHKNGSAFAARRRCITN